MIEISAISASALTGQAPLISRLGVDMTAIPVNNGPGSFQSVLAAGLESINDKIATANDMVRQFAVDDNVPVHQVTIALEEARLSVELAMQVRTRLLEGYRELMNMQL